MDIMLKTARETSGAPAGKNTDETRRRPLFRFVPDGNGGYGAEDGREGLRLGVAPKDGSNRRYVATYTDTRSGRTIATAEAEAGAADTAQLYGYAMLKTSWFADAPGRPYRAMLENADLVFTDPEGNPAPEPEGAMA